MVNFLKPPQTRKTLHLLLVFQLLTMTPWGSAGAYADPVSPAGASAEGVAVSPTAAPEMAQSATTSPGNVTIDFKDADIQNVMRILSFKSGVNIVAGKDVVGQVTIRLVDVPWEKGLDVGLKT